MKRVFQISVLFLIFGFITSCKVDERKMEFIRDLQNRYNCEVSLGDTYEKRTNQDTKKFITVTFSDCDVLKKDKNKEMTGIALEVFKMNLDDIDLAGVIMDVNSEETIFDTDLLNEVLKGEAYMFDLFNLISLKKYDTVYADLSEETKSLTSKKDFTNFMDTINTQVDFINFRLNNFGFIKETIEGQNYELVYLEGYFGTESKDRFGLFLPRNFERKIYGLEIEEISGE